jgi:O-antigen/teichoic acid export membrane protein
MRDALLKISSAVLTQGIILLISVVTGFVMPAMMGTEMFGYWQIYMLYLAYLNIFGLGYNDGIALFYGGYAYEKLPFHRINSAAAVFCFQTALITLLALVGVFFFMEGFTKYIFIMLALNIPLIAIQCVILTIYLAVHNIKFYNTANLLLRVVTVAFYVIVLSNGIIDFHFVIAADFAGRLIITLVCVFYGRRLLFGRKINLRIGVSELKEKSLAGIHITIGILASSFILMVGRVAVQYFEPISVFGEYSFAIMLMQIVTAFTGVAGTVLFPIMKRIDEEKLPQYLAPFSIVTNSVLYLARFLYIPIVLIVRRYMPEYLEVLAYLPVLFAATAQLGNIQILVIAYYKTFRLERRYLLINMIFLVLMAGATFAAYMLFGTVLAVAIATAVVIYLWYIAAVLLLEKKIKASHAVKNHILDLLLYVGFIFAASFHNLAIFAGIYAIFVLLYLVLNRGGIKRIVGKSFFAL